MTILEKLIERQLENIKKELPNGKCPYDYGFNDIYYTEECGEGINANPALCKKCWNREYKEGARDVYVKNCNALYAILRRFMSR